MSKLIQVILVILYLLTISSCKPYNSDEVNNRMIQGKWRLVDIEREQSDTVNEDLEQQEVFLIFDGNKCTQDMVGLITTEYTFSIHNYTLMLYKDSVFDNNLYINTLTSDSLIFTKGADQVMIYKKMEQ
ncbi:hypothetical protein D0T84_04760 [Dysgonomonas sp. 521]|uniref:hypothetical protein n=1 Tax=Dysgonomonas sp. 521 TaxID=2302932 RepID=UPI0013D7AAD9|nr:hypothetical protein [Dysgonomonas sp. 521]NDV94230.1 hypothetical protein [Dysgonomonas sp. 521]